MDARGEVYCYCRFLCHILEISEAPYVEEKTTVSEDKTEIDKKYFENIVTKTPDEITTGSKETTN